MRLAFSLVSARSTAPPSVFVPKPSHYVPLLIRRSHASKERTEQILRRTLWKHHFKRLTVRQCASARHEWKHLWIMHGLPSPILPSPPQSYPYNRTSAGLYPEECDRPPSNHPHSMGSALTSLFHEVAAPLTPLPPRASSGACASLAAMCLRTS